MCRGFITSANILNCRLKDVENRSIPVATYPFPMSSRKREHYYMHVFPLNHVKKNVFVNTYNLEYNYGENTPLTFIWCDINGF